MKYSETNKHISEYLFSSVSSLYLTWVSQMLFQQVPDLITAKTIDKFRMRIYFFFK